MKVIDCFSAGKMKILILDEPIPDINFSSVIIAGNTFKVTIPYDISNSIAIESNGDYLNKEIEFI